ncbi:hypothetical protein EVJ50_08475 [Synechococcus sp. RSCCF101]|uniref:DUF7734 family protein n=1 Tax=Synechococcus sp. RSCCF101 TaxID=2511069 RepID=UPI00124489FE|nr:hypothetical protein [Synechococcus sp. RSCCF101]QEY32250.1 hypothetical protein EVJ50_08475 [Synechococcus sp. RSCCF101]
MTDPSAGDPLSPYEALSRAHPELVLRLSGRCPGDEGAEEPLELLIYRGMSSCTSHPLPWDPDRSALPPGATLESAQLFAAPLDPAAPSLTGPLALRDGLDPALWQRLGSGGLSPG